MDNTAFREAFLHIVTRVMHASFFVRYRYKNDILLCVTLNNLDYHVIPHGHLGSVSFVSAVTSNLVPG